MPDSIEGLSVSVASLTEKIRELKDSAGRADEDLERQLRDLDKKVRDGEATIGTYVTWTRVGLILAVVFGATGAWGLKILNTAKSDLTSLSSDVGALGSSVDSLKVNLSGFGTEVSALKEDLTNFSAASKQALADFADTLKQEMAAHSKTLIAAENRASAELSADAIATSDQLKLDLASATDGYEADVKRFMQDNLGSAKILASSAGSQPNVSDESVNGFRTHIETWYIPRLNSSAMILANGWVYSPYDSDTGGAGLAGVVTSISIDYALCSRDTDYGYNMHDTGYSGAPSCVKLVGPGTHVISIIRKEYATAASSPEAHLNWVVIAASDAAN